MKKIIILLSSILISVSTFSAEQILATITCDKDLVSKSELILITDEKNDIVSMTKKAYTLKNNRWEIDYVKEFTDLSVLPTTGLLVAEKKSRKVAILKSSNFSAHQGGDIKLVYLYSGVTSSYRTFNLDLQRRGDHWALVVKNKEVKEIQLIANVSTFFGMIGISNIIVK